MKTRHDSLHTRALQLRTAAIVLSILALVALTSCGSASSTAGRSGVQQWNIELTESIVDKCSGNNILALASDVQPQYMPATETREARVRILALIECEREEDRVYELPASRIKRITYVADPLLPPKVYRVEDGVPPPDRCCRVRTGTLSFDKLELRAMAGFRGRDKETYLHQTATGQEPYESSFFNLERGGSTMLIGIETAGLWSLDEQGAFQIGPFLGLWPTDGSVFIPLGVHPRYTFSPNPDPNAFTPDCNTWFVYGDLGIPLDFQSGAPLIGSSFDRQRLYYGLGIGHDWAWGCKLDFSVDIGVRRMHVPLPEIECCPDVPDDQRNAYRQSTSLYLRLGITF